ncbi:hypothetical protein JZ751_004200 [Albula glossodonta]|uniref:Uncharacterized protein n=1 Tax=Albula glossodonta TaxID=121402 RepID=A0A8T2MV53_9TELE|nr:hypothetical protein JZ751_004200 [Albula glossodonta]
MEAAIAQFCCSSRKGFPVTGPRITHGQLYCGFHLLWAFVRSSIRPYNDSLCGAVFRKARCSGVPKYGPLGGTPPPYAMIGYDAERAEEQRRHHDILPYIDDSPLSSPRLMPELYDVHKEFYDGLLPRVQQWSHHQRVGELFHKLRCRRLHGPGLIAKRAKRAFQMRRPRALTSLQTQGIRCHGNTSGPKAAVAAQWRGGGFSGFFAVTKSVVGSVAFREAPVGKSIRLQPGNQNPDLRPRIPGEICSSESNNAPYGRNTQNASQLGLYRAFVDNYKVAVETAEKCCQANAQFAEISEVKK